MELRLLPEYIVEDMAETFLLIMRAAPRLLPQLNVSDFVRFAVVFVASPALIKNPYVRAKLVEVRFFFFHPLGWFLFSHPSVQVLVFFTPYQYENERAPPEVLGHLLDSRDAQEHLAPALMRLYVEVENTGAAHAFYDKFSIRYHISAVIKYVWASAAHRRSIVQASMDKDNFLQFVNHLRSDTTFLLDESLTKVPFSPS